MTITLKALRLTPRGVTGWQSDELLFGERMTELYGPNGCGKTPLLSALAHALGAKVTFRNDILEHCEAAVLTLQVPEGPARISRRLQTEFDATIDWAGESLTFYSEREFTNFMFEKMGFDNPHLTSNASEPVQAYMSTVLPLIFLDQDTSYTSLYKASGSFIRDQHAEMVRILFGLAPKHSYDRKKLQIERKRQLEELDKQIVRAQDALGRLEAQRGPERRPLSVIEEEMSAVTQRLEALRSSNDLRRDAGGGLNPLIDQKAREVERVERLIADLLSRIDGLARIEREIESEIETLSLNEEARRVFAGFNEICGKPGCGLLVAGSDSYGKNLLYLRDQIKDLRASNAMNEGRLAAASEARGALQREIKELQLQQREAKDQAEPAALIAAVAQLTSALFTLQREKSLESEVVREEQLYVKLLGSRGRLQDELAALGSSEGGDDLESLRVRSEWRQLICHWLDVLQTKNVSRDVEIDSDFNVLFGKEKVTQIKGSTLVRVVLAVRTACFQLYTSNPKAQLRFFTLDTPRQHDIERESLARYMSALRRLATSSNTQIIFSTTDYHYDASAGDAEWTPQYPGAEQKMFLKRLGKP